MKYIIIYISVFLSTFCLPNNGKPQYVNDFKVNDDIPGLLFQTNASMDANDNGYFGIVWENYGGVSSGVPKILYLQIFDIATNRIGPNIRINNDDTISTRAAITARKDSSFVIVWIQNTYKYRIFNKFGIPITNELTLNDSIMFGSTKASIDVDNNNNIYCTYYHTASFNTPRIIYFQKLNSMGVKVIGPLRVNDDTTNSTKELPAITIRKDGSSIITWRDFRLNPGGGGDIFMQMLDSNGIKIGVNTLVNDDGSFAVDQNYPSVSADSSGNFNITWEDNRLTKNTYQPFCQAFNSAGVKVGANFRVDQGISLSKHNPIISKRSDGKYVIGWSNQSGNNVLPMFRRFNANNTPISGNDTISKPYLSTSKGFNAIKIIGDRIITVWRDKRNEPEEGDIYCNIRSFQNPDSTISFITPIQSQIPERHNLYQNYPNPFNPTTKIQFEIPYNTNVTLTFYNSLGQTIAVLINEKLTAGKYEYTWNAQELPGGVYFYVLRTKDFYTAKTALLIK